MRKIGLALLALLLLTACAPSQAPAPAQPPEVQPPAPSAPPAPVVKAEELRVEPGLTLQTARPAKLYTGPGPYYLLIRELPEAAAVSYLGNREGWLRVRTPQGEIGWLQAVDATITDSRGQPVSYRIKSGQWLVETGAGLTVAVTRPGTGALRLTVTGLGDVDPQIVALDDGKGVAILGPGPAGLKAAVDIGEAGVGRVSLTERGLLVDLEGSPLYQVVEKGHGGAILEFRPGLRSISRTGQGWAFAYQGALRPVLRPEAGSLVLDLPGALLAPGAAIGDAAVEEVAPEPGGGQMQPGGAETQLGSSTAAIPSRMTAGGLRVRQPLEAGKPYALYRSGPDRYELRFLPPGLAGKTVVIDPGHGGEEMGAVGPAGTLEKHVNLAVALRLKALLEAAGARVIMTRTADTRVLAPEQAAAVPSEVERTQLDLGARVALAAESGADLFLSIHANGGPPSEGGTEVYWAVPNLNAANSRKLAELAQEELLGALHLADRGVRQRPFNVIRLTDAPAALVELGFMTNAAEERLLNSQAGQEAAAQALLRAVRRYFESF